MTERLDSQAGEWPLRPWIMAAIAAVAGLIFHSLVHEVTRVELSAEKQAAATLVAVATISFIVTVERLRWLWAVAFAVGWGTVIAFVGWFTASYNRNGEIAEFPFLAGIAAVLIAAPLFQTVRDEGAWRFPYKKLHGHAWADAVIGAASLFFTGITFLLAWLIAGLFDVIGIDALKDLLQEGWFNWMLAGFAFGGAFGLLRERDRLVATLQRLVMIVLSVLAPVLAAALSLFLLSTLVTGLEKLWEGWLSATALLLTASAGAALLVNAVIGDGREERAGNRILVWSAMVLTAVVLPLALLAAAAMGMRIGQYGWTPERMWGAVAIAIASAYGLIGWWSIWRGRRDFDDVLRPLQVSLSIAVCGLMLFLALPILDFGALSARSQVARLESGKVEPAKFDWAALAFDFGPSGRRKLGELARTGRAEWRALAGDALKAKERWGVAEATRAATEADDVARRIRVIGPGVVVTPQVLRAIAARQACPEDAHCALLRVDATRLALVTKYGQSGPVAAIVIDPAQPRSMEVMRPSPEPPKVDDLANSRIEVRDVPRRQVFVDGKPVGQEFE
ncbi:MAG TPA: DUF4153 domain-containing protein [Sphingomicrobium sp.]